MAEEPNQAQSIHARIAALNLGHVGRAPRTAYPSNNEAPGPPQLAPRRQTTEIPTTANSLHAKGIGNEPNGVEANGVLPPPAATRAAQNSSSTPIRPTPPPRLPPRKHSTGPSPALPPRNPSEQTPRRGSNESISSTISSISVVSAGTNGATRTSGSRTTSMDAGRKLAPLFDPTSLPPLPPKRTPEQVEKRYQDTERSRMGLKPTKSTSSVTTVEVTPAPVVVSHPRPPHTPARTESTNGIKKLPPAQPPPMPVRSALTFGMNKTPEPQETKTPQAEIPSPGPSPSVPPPVPLSSRPDLSKIQATKPKVHSAATSAAQLVRPACLTCRDFSAPDAHAAKFPRESVPSLDWLATQLVSPFSSSPTDQARAIFTWLHHNIAYDIIAFCNFAIQPSTPASTLSTGLAVCEGYAGLFTAIASKAGLESIVISGHGKGAGFTALKPGDPIPAEYSTHAWNAAKIDNGEWKLIDTCWGAGYVELSKQSYTKRFAPRFFTMDNDEFGLRHFPTNKALFYRTDGRAQIPWEEYILGPQRGGGVAEQVTVYSGVAENEGIAEAKIQPPQLKISITPSAGEPTVRFQLEKVCGHWDPVRNGPGKPYPYIVMIGGIDGRKQDSVVMETNGVVWWADVERKRLGCRGQKVTLYTVESVGGKSARGMSGEEVRKAKGRQGMKYGGVAAWELA